MARGAEPARAEPGHAGAADAAGAAQGDGHAGHRKAGGAAGSGAESALHRPLEPARRLSPRATDRSPEDAPRCAHVDDACDPAPDGRIGCIGLAAAARTRAPAWPRGRARAGSRRHRPRGRGEGRVGAAARRPPHWPNSGRHWLRAGKTASLPRSPHSSATACRWCTCRPRATGTRTRTHSCSPSDSGSANPLPAPQPPRRTTCCCATWRPSVPPRSPMPARGRASRAGRPWPSASGRSCARLPASRARSCSTCRARRAPVPTRPRRRASSPNGTTCCSRMPTAAA